MKLPRLAVQVLSRTTPCANTKLSPVVDHILQQLPMWVNLSVSKIELCWASLINVSLYLVKKSVGCFNHAAFFKLNLPSSVNRFLSELNFIMLDIEIHYSDVLTMTVAVQF